MEGVGWGEGLAGRDAEAPCTCDGVEWGDAELPCTCDDRIDLKIGIQYLFRAE